MNKSCLTKCCISCEDKDTCRYSCLNKKHKTTCKDCYSQIKNILKKDGHLESVLREEL